jgi:hypothetical protein
MAPPDSLRGHAPWQHLGQDRSTRRGGQLPGAGGGIQELRGVRRHNRLSVRPDQALSVSPSDQLLVERRRRHRVHQLLLGAAARSSLAGIANPSSAPRQPLVNAVLAWNGRKARQSDDAEVSW